MNVTRIRLALWALAAMAAIALPIAYVARTPITERATGVANVGGAFVLTAAKGGEFDSKSLSGKPYAVFFGFTHCPDICPTTMAELTGMLKDLGDQANSLNVVFITVDPERDTPAVMTDYLSNFDARIIGLTGSPDQIAHVVAQYRVYAKKVALDGGQYTMDHSASIFLYGRDGRLRSTLDYGEKPLTKLAKLRNLLTE